MKKIVALVLAVLFCTGLIACSAKSSFNSGASFDSMKEFDSVTPMDPIDPVAPVDPVDPEYGYNESVTYPSVSDTPTAGAPTVGDAQSMSEKIIRTVTIQAQTKEYDRVIADIRASVLAIGGFEEQFRSTGKSYYNNGVYSRSAYLLLRIPAESLDAFLNDVGDMVNVINQNASANNVTGEYYDVKSRISVLETEREAYEAMLQEAKDVSELLKIKDRLYNVIEEIESQKTRLNLLDSKVAYSTVSISLDEVVEYTPVVYTEPTFGERVKDAFVTSWQNFAKGAQNTAVWFVESFPTLLVIAVILGGAGAIAFGVIRKRKAKAAQAIVDVNEPKK